MEKQSYRDRLVNLDKASVDTVEEFCKKHGMAVEIKRQNTIDNIKGFAQLKLSTTQSEDERTYLKCVMRACFSLISLRDTVDYKIVELIAEIEKVKKGEPNLVGVHRAEKMFTLHINSSVNHSSYEDLPVSLYELRDDIDTTLLDKLGEASMEKIKKAFEKQEYTVLSMEFKNRTYNEQIEDSAGNLQTVFVRKLDGITIEVRVKEPLKKTLESITKAYQDKKTEQISVLTAKLEQMRRSKK